MPQKAAIWSNANEVFSTSQTAVAFGIRGLRSVMGSSVPDRHLDVFIDRACGLQGIDRGVFGRLMPLYLIVFLYLKRNYGVAIRERIGDLLRQISAANGLNGAPRARAESQGAC